METSALIAAGGTGKRFGGSRRKQYINLHGRSILAWSLCPFINSDKVHEIIVVVPDEDIEYCIKTVIEPFGNKKPIRVVAGGAYRQESVALGLENISGSSEIIIVHDAARPFFTEEMLEEGIAACMKAEAVLFAVPEIDTVVEVKDRKLIRTMDRESLWRVQTPQIFYRRLLLEAFKKAKKENFTGTDESILIRNLGHPVEILMGSYENIKVTHAEDIELAEMILARREVLKGGKDLN